MSETPNILAGQNPPNRTPSFEPIQAHVEAALVQTDAPYPPPVDQLLRLSEAHDADPAERIAQLGLGQEHVADLVRLARDRRLNLLLDDTDESWGPIYAIMALTQLDASDYVNELVPLFDLESDWIVEELPVILGRAGRAALEPLHAYIHDDSRWFFGRAAAINALSMAAHQHPDLRDQVVATLTGELARAAEQDPGINGDIIGNLVIDLHATEALPIIRRAFELDRVDESIMGDWLDVLEKLEQEIDPADPLVARYQQLRQSEPNRRRAIPPFEPPVASVPVLRANRSAKPISSALAKKNKQKRKAATLARKTNKRKKK